MMQVLADHLSRENFFEAWHRVSGCFSDCDPLPDDLNAKIISQLSERLQKGAISPEAESVLINGVNILDYHGQTENARMLNAVLVIFQISRDE